MIASYFFRFLNLAVLIGFARYVFKYHISDSLKATIAAHVAHMRSLAERVTALRNEKEKTQESVREARTDSRRMKKCVDMWRTVVEHQQVAEKKMVEACIAQMQKRKARQQHFLSTDIMRRQLLPQALDRARMQLMQRYGTAVGQKNYLKAVVQSMRDQVKS